MVIELEKALPHSRVADSYFSGMLDFIVNNAKIGLWEMSLPERKVIHNRQYELILGYEEGFSLKWEEVVYSEDIQFILSLFNDFIAGKTVTYNPRYRVARKDGSLIWVQDIAFITERGEKGVPKRILGTFQDISEIKNAEEKLKEKQRQTDFIAKAAGFTCWEYDIASDRIIYTDFWLNIPGVTNDTINSTKFSAWFDSLYPDDKKIAGDLISALLCGKIDRAHTDIRFCVGPDSYIWTRVHLQISKWDENGTPISAMGVTLNIDELKRTEEKLQKALIENRRHSEHLQSDIDIAIKNLEQSQEFSQLLFDTNPDINLIFNNKFELFDCNPAALDFWGYVSKEEMLAKAIKEISQGIPEYQSNGRRSISLVERLIFVAQNGYSDFETELYVKGKLHIIRTIFKKISYKESFVIVCFAVDITLITQVKKDLVYQDRLLTSINMSASHILSSEPATFDHAIWEFLRNIGKIIAVHRILIWRNFTDENDKLCAKVIFEWVDDMKYKKELDYFAKTDYVKDAPSWYTAALKRKNLNIIIKDYPEKERARFENRGVVSVLGIPLFFEGNFWGFFIFDDCERERAFTQIEENVLGSASMLAISAILKNETTANLIKSREEALAASKAKSDFLSRMSHEIRTPMNAIIGMTAIAEKTSDMTRLRYCLSHVDSASRQLLQLINDILDMSKIEADKFEILLKEFDFEKMIQNTINVIQIKFEEKRQQFIVNFDSLFTRLLISDELRLSQVLLNLLSNANKFTPENGTVAIKIAYNALDKNRIRLHIEVIDTGIGISAAQQARLFNSFEQADGSITRKFGGSGLGLALCKKILNLMGGKIWIESELGKGSSFIFEFEAEWGQTREKERTEELPAGMTVLVIDNSEDTLEYFSHILAAFSLSCKTANSGKKGVDLLKKSVAEGNPFDIAFVDWRLSQENSAAVIGEIKRITEKCAVALMSVEDWQDIEGGDSIAIDRFITKPVLPSSLYNTIISLSQKAGTVIKPDKKEIIDFTGKFAGKIILVVEDIEINQEILEGILENTGVTLEFADNGRIAVDLFKKQGEKYALALMDLQMPEMDGFEATRRIRALGGYAEKIPIVAMTANAFNEDITACLSCGMDGHLAKPIDEEELMKTLSAYLL